MKIIYFECRSSCKIIDRYYDLVLTQPYQQIYERVENKINESYCMKSIFCDIFLEQGMLPESCTDAIIIRSSIFI
jgi:hypothetical protein